MKFTHIEALADEVAIPENGTLSRTVHRDDQIKVVLFAFDAGEELTEHTAAVPVTIQVIVGSLELTADARTVTVRPGTWTWLPANMPHSVRASERAVMLLTLLASEHT